MGSKSKFGRGFDRKVLFRVAVLDKIAGHYGLALHAFDLIAHREKTVGEINLAVILRVHSGTVAS